jgi:hypothetical protein
MSKRKSRESKQTELGSNFVLPLSISSLYIFSRKEYRQHTTSWPAVIR